MSCASVSSSNFSPSDKIASVIWKFWCFRLVTAIWNSVVSEDLLPYKCQQAHLPPRIAGLIKLSFAGLRNGENDLWLQGDPVSLPGRAASRAVQCPISAVWLSPPSVSWRAKSCIFYACHKKGFWMGLSSLNLLESVFLLLVINLRHCFQDTLIWAVTRLIISGNDE